MNFMNETSLLYHVLFRDKICDELIDRNSLLSDAIWEQMGNFEAACKVAPPLQEIMLYGKPDVSITFNRDKN